MIGLPPLHLLPIGLDELEVAALRLRGSEPFLSRVLDRTRTSLRERRFGDRVQVERLVVGGYLVDGELAGENRGWMVGLPRGGVPIGPVRYGAPGRVLSVR